MKTPDILQVTPRWIAMLVAVSDLILIIWAEPITVWTNHKIAFLLYIRALWSDITRSWCRLIISCHFNLFKSTLSYRTKNVKTTQSIPHYRSIAINLIWVTNVFHFNQRTWSVSSVHYFISLFDTKIKKLTVDCSSSIDIRKKSPATSSQNISSLSLLHLMCIFFKSLMVYCELMLNISLI